MKAIVVYESYWGNTASVARAIAEGLGQGARAMSTAEAVGEALAGVDLVVAGSPIIAFSLPSEKTRNNMVAKPDKKAPSPPDLSHPSIRTWLVALPPADVSGGGTAVRAAAFETGFKLSPGGSAGKILRMLGEKGYRPIAKKQRFLVQASYGPMKDGELDRAKAWGAELANINS
jgi:flavodoxin